MRVGCSVAVHVLVLSAGLLAAEAESEAAPKIARNFTVRWSSMRYDKAVVVENPEVAKTPGQRSETLTLSCQVEVCDPNLVLGISRTGVATQVTDGKGRDLAVTPSAVGSHEMYEGLHYTRQFRRPAPAPAWREFIWKILRRPPQSPGPPQLVDQLQPNQINVRLDLDLLDQAGAGLRSIKGYFRAIVPRSIEHVEVPFEPNNTWVRLTPEMEIQVAEAIVTGTSFQYRIEVRPQGGRSMRPLTVGASLPARMVVAQQFLGEDGKPMGFSSNFGPVIPRVGGRGTHGGGGRAKTIRFVIAVEPKECKVPFEVQRIPLPKP